MSGKQRNIATKGTQFVGGGLAYGAIEILWRGNTHLSMLIAGGVGLIILVYISKSRYTLPIQSLFGAMAITTVELVFGCVVNLWMGLNVWDYSSRPLNLWGQICYEFFFLWYLLCFAVLTVCHFIAKQKLKINPAHTHTLKEKEETAA